MLNWTILVVEDDPDGQEVVSRILQHHRVSIEIAPDAEYALELLGRMPFTAAVIDLALPGMDGWRLLEAIQNDPETSGLPCVAVTAFHSAEVAVEAIEAGFKAYFPKPLEPTSFVRELESVFDPGD